jgi:hypothetical protein
MSIINKAGETFPRELKPPAVLLRAMMKRP